METVKPQTYLRVIKKKKKKKKKICANTVTLLRRNNNLFFSCVDLLYLISFILIFWLRNLTDSARDTDYAGIFFVGNFIKLVKKIQKIEKIFNIIYQSYEDSIYFEKLLGIS